MYLRKARRLYKGKTYTNYVLVESVRTAKGPRQKTICSLGDLGPRPREAWLKLAHKIERALSNEPDLLDDPDDPQVARILAKVRAREARAAAKAKARKAPPSGAAADLPAPDQLTQAADGAGAPRHDADTEAVAEAPVAVLPEKVSSERHRSVGASHVGLAFWRRLGLDGILAEAGLDPPSSLLTCAMTLNRLIAPSSEHAMPDWFRQSAVSDLLGCDLEDIGEDRLYRNMDRLYPLRGAIERALVAKERNLFHLAGTIYLYDITSTYFEGQAAANPKAKRGYSRDKRPDCKQVLIALALGPEGFPVAHEILAGNRQDRTTLAEMLDRLEKSAGLKAGDSVIVDRGMAFEENLAELTARELHYIVASRQPERDQWLADFAESDGFQPIQRKPSPTNPCQKKSVVKVKLQRQDGLTFVLCHSQGRQDKDRAIREKHELRLLGDLEKLARRIAAGKLKKPAAINKAIGRLQERYPRVAKYYEIDYDSEARTLTRQRNEEAHAKARELDGCYILKTDRSDLTAEEAWRLYILLTRVEAAFRSLKSPLAERPIFHQIERRVETHIFLCLIAYHLLVAIETTLREHGNHSSWATIRQQLASHQICTIVLPTTSGATLRIRKAATPEPQHREIYRQLKIPAQIIKPRKTWSSS
jgi:transposase